MQNVVERKLLQKIYVFGTDSNGWKTRIKAKLYSQYKDANELQFMNG